MRRPGLGRHSRRWSVARGGRDSLNEQLNVLAALMRLGRDVTVSELLVDDGPGRDAIVSHLKRLAKQLPTLVKGQKTARGWVYRFHWPKDSTVNPTQVLA